MRALSPIWNLWRLEYYRWALREIDQLHPDVPAIVCKIHQLENAQ